MLEAVALNLVKYALSEDVGTGDITTLNAVGSMTPGLSNTVAVGEPPSTSLSVPMRPVCATTSPTARRG